MPCGWTSSGAPTRSRRRPQSRRSGVIRWARSPRCSRAGIAPFPATSSRKQDSRPALLERLKPRGDKPGLFGVGLDLGKVLLVISDRRVGVLPLQGDLTQHSADAVSGGKLLEERLVVGLRRVQAARSQIGNGAIEPGHVSIRQGQRARERWYGVRGIPSQDAKNALVSQGRWVVGRKLQLAISEADCVGVTLVVREGGHCARQ